MKNFFETGFYSISGVYLTGSWMSSKSRRHVRDFNPEILSTHGYFCPYCGYRLRYRAETSYYCDCQGWAKNGERILNDIESHTDESL